MQIIVFDIKAGNVLLDADRVTAKITDVGLSKMLAGSNTATLLVRPPKRYRCILRPGNLDPAIWTLPAAWSVQGAHSRQGRTALSSVFAAACL